MAWHCPFKKKPKSSINVPWEPEVIIIIIVIIVINNIATDTLGSVRKLSTLH